MGGRASFRGDTMQKRFQFSVASMQYQEVFQFQDKALSSIDQAAARRMVKVFDQAWATRLWSQVPMLPTRPQGGWRQEPKEARRDLQNTFQLNALAMDMGILRSELAMVGSFRQFIRRAREAVRLFDMRVGPPWWIGDRAFLEVAYVASQEQEKPDRELNESLWCHWGDDAEDTPYWVAENFFDHLHACEADILGQCRWARKSHGWTKDEYKANLLLNWQVLMQPHLAICPDDEEFSSRRPDTFPHQHELRRLIRLLNKETVHAADASSAAAGAAAAAPGESLGADALRRPRRPRTRDVEADHVDVRQDRMVVPVG